MLAVPNMAGPVQPELQTRPSLGSIPSLIQTKRKDRRDNFELIAAAEGGGLVQVERNNEKAEGGKYPWSKPVFFAQSLGVL